MTDVDTRLTQKDSFSKYKTQHKTENRITIHKKYRDNAMGCTHQIISATPNYQVNIV
jgi:hypothetical protein